MVHICCESSFSQRIKTLREGAGAATVCHCKVVRGAMAGSVCKDVAFQHNYSNLFLFDFEGHGNIGDSDV